MDIDGTCWPKYRFRNTLQYLSAGQLPNDFSLPFCKLTYWLVVSTILKNMKAIGKDYSLYVEKSLKPPTSIVCGKQPPFLELGFLCKHFPNSVVSVSPWKMCRTLSEASCCVSILLVEGSPEERYPGS